MARPLQKQSPVNPGRARGFTLIEMMIVVTIVGILAMLAVVGYRKIIQSSHVTEATNTVQAIRVAQEAYHAETQQYADISTDLTGSWYPNATPKGNLLSPWTTAACTGACLLWSALPLHIDGPVMFGYSTRAGAAGNPLPGLPPDMAAVQLVAPNTDWFVVDAMCDIDLNGAPNTYVLAVSWSNQVLTFNEGM